MKFVDKILMVIITIFAVPFMFLIVHFIKLVEFVFSNDKKNFKSQILPFGILMQPFFESLKRNINRK